MTLTGLGVVLFSVFGLPLFSAGAAIACLNDGIPRFDGFTNYNFSNGTYFDPNVEGISANIRLEAAPLCNNPDLGNTSSAWVLEQEHPSHGTGRGVVGGLAQVGFEMDPANTAPTFFYEYGANDPGVAHYWHGARTPGQTHRFWVQWIVNSGSLNPQCGNSQAACFALNIDTTRIATSDFNPYAVWGAPTLGNEWGIEYLGETHDGGSDMPGTDAGGVATVYSVPQLQDWITDQYYTTPCNFSAYSPIFYRYGLNYPSSYGCQTWSLYTYH